MTQSHALTESLQMYLKAIYLVEQRKQAARATDVARELGVIPSSVTTALRALSRLDLVNYAPYDLITLTAEGRRTAKDIMHKYAALRDFFVKVLGVDEETAETEACQMEHRISETVFDRLLHFVEYYEQCPYGHAGWDNRIGYFCSRTDTDCVHCDLHERDTRAEERDDDAE